MNPLIAQAINNEIHQEVMRRANFELDLTDNNPLFCAMKIEDMSKFKKLYTIVSKEIMAKYQSKTITIIYTVKNALRMKVLEMKQDWVAQCEELDTQYPNWRVV